MKMHQTIQSWVGMCCVNLLKLGALGSRTTNCSLYGLELAKGETYVHGHLHRDPGKVHKKKVDGEE